LGNDSKPYFFRSCRYNEEKDAIAFEIEKDTFGRDIEGALDNLDVLKSTPNKDER
jgi:hypothetical protein